MKLSVIVGFLFVLCLSFRVAVSAPPHPHIILILGDDLGNRDLGYQGAEFPTPALDKLAYSGVRLNHLYAQPLCSPSRVSLMTGRYPGRVGLQHIIMLQSQAAGVPLEEKMLSEKLMDLGYRNHAVGKWHLGFYQPQYTPLQRGFHTHFGFLSADIDYYTHAMGRDNICNPYDKNCSSCFYGYDFWKNTKSVAKRYFEKYSANLFNDEAISRIMDHPSNDIPFFLYLTPSNPHTPLEADEFFVNKYCKGITNATRRTYCGQVGALDSLVQNVTTALKTKGLWEDSVLIFMSDNGGEIFNAANANNELNFSYACNYPLRSGKGTVWEGGIRVPGFVVSNLIPKAMRGTVFDGLVHISDIFPTIVEGIIGANTSDSRPLDGMNVWKSITKGTPSPRKEVFANYDQLDASSGAYIMWPWKIVVGNNTLDYQLRSPNPPHVPPPNLAGQSPCSAITGSTDYVRLYNIKTDPSECTNVFFQNPKIAMRLYNRFLQIAHGIQFPDFPFSDPNANPKYFGGNWAPWETNQGKPLVGKKDPCTCSPNFVLKTLARPVFNRGPDEC